MYSYLAWEGFNYLRCLFQPVQTARDKGVYPDTMSIVMTMRTVLFALNENLLTAASVTLWRLTELENVTNTGSPAKKKKKKKKVTFNTLTVHTRVNY